MIPTLFPEANTKFGPPPDLTESQCQIIPAFVSEVKSGSCDGVPLIVVAWKPNEQELKDINEGLPIFLSCIGGLPPHFLVTRFEQAINPA